MLSDDFPRDVEAESEPAGLLRRRRALEAVEDALERFGFNATAAVIHHQDRFGAAALERDRDGMAGSIFERVRYDIDDGLLEPEAVGPGAYARLDIEAKLAARFFCFLGNLVR